MELLEQRDGAAQESNLPSRGLRDLTGLEDATCLAQPSRSGLVRATMRAGSEIEERADAVFDSREGAGRHGAPCFGLDEPVS